MPGSCCFVLLYGSVLFFPFFFLLFYFAFLSALLFRFLLFPFLQLRRCHGVAHGQEGKDILIGSGTVQEEGDPLILVHVVSRKEAGFAPEGANDHRITFDIQDVHGALLPEAEGLVRDSHYDTEPLAVVNVAEDAGVIVHPERIVRFHAVFIENIICQFLPGHFVFIPCIPIRVPRGKSSGGSCRHRCRYSLR